MDVPRIGGARGVFDVFVPGLFLWLNFIGLAYVWPSTDDSLRIALEKSVAAHLAPAIVLSIVFGYLIGVLLRLLRCERLDRMSACWLRMFSHGARVDLKEGEAAAKPRHSALSILKSRPLAVLRRIRGKCKPFAVERFPYFAWIEHLCQYRYACNEAREFFAKMWKPAAPATPQETANGQFFNFRKVLISCSGGAPSAELYTAEALTRYIAGTFHALFVAAVAAILTATVRWYHDEPAWGLDLLALAYLYAITRILSNFRLVRIKEVETVFAADFHLWLRQQRDQERRTHMGRNSKQERAAKE